MDIRTALYIYLPMDATPEEIEAAHNIIDGQFGTNPQAIVSNNPNPGPVVSAAGVQMSATNNMGGAVVANAVATGVELDVDGLPWDERIHSSNHKKDSKGGWWAKRGVDAATRTKVTAELRAAVSAPAVATNAAAAPVVSANLPSIPGTPALPVVNAVDPAYAALVQLIASNTNSPANPTGRLTDDWVKQLLTAFKVPDGSLQNLAHAPQLVAPIHEYLAKALAS